MQEILGRFLEVLAWIPLFHFYPRLIRMPDSIPEVYLIRDRDDPKKLKLASMLYIGSWT